MKCIFCLKDFTAEETQQEFIFPAQIGGSLKFWKICKNCGGKVQSVNDNFVNNSLIRYAGFVRNLKNADKINPLGDCQATLAEIENAITPAEGEEPADLKEILGRDVNLEPIFTGMLKMVYELAFYWLGDNYAYDEYAKKLRDAINAQKIEDYEPYIELLRTEDYPFAHEATEHSACIYMNEGKLYIVLKLFDLISIHVLVSENKQHYRELPTNPVPYVVVDTVYNMWREPANAFANVK